MVQDTKHTRSRQSTSEPGAPTAEGCVQLAIALDRLFNLAALYPSGHASCQEVSDEFRRHLKPIVGTGKSLEIGISADALIIQGHALDANRSGVQRPWEILSRQGISGLEIGTDITNTDIRELVALLLKYRSKAESAQEFHQFDYSSLPETIRIRRRRFGAEGSIEQRQIEEAIRNVTEVLKGWDLSPEQQDACDAMLDKLLQEAVDRLETLESSSASNRLTSQSPSPEADLGLAVLHRIVRKMLPREGNLDDLLNRSSLTDTAVSLTNSQESVELMIRLLSNETDPSTTATAPKHAPKEKAPAPAHTMIRSAAPRTFRNNEYKYSLSKMRHGIARLQAATEPIITLSSENYCEEIAVAFHCLKVNDSPLTSGWLKSRLALILENRLSENETRKLSEGIITVLARNDSSLTDRVLPLIILPMRKSKQTSVSALLADICADVSPLEQDQLWPYVVNEILVDFEKEDPRIIEILGRFISSRPLETNDLRLTRLQNLDALRDGNLSNRVLRAHVRWLMPVIARLLSSSREKQIGPHVFAAFNTRRCDWPGSQVLDLLGNYRSSHRDFFVRLLEDTAADRISDPLRDMAGRILVRALPSLASERREEGWVPGAIRALAALKPPRAETVLNEIRNKRRLLLIPVWPSDARTAAGQALSILQVNRRSSS